MLELVTIYEYIIENKTIKQFKYEAEENEKHYYLVQGRSGNRFIDKRDFEKIMSNRIISYKDDLHEYTRILIEYQEDKVQKYKKQYEQQLEVLEELLKLR